MTAAISAAVPFKERLARQARSPSRPRMVSTCVPEPQLRQVERLDMSPDRPNRMVHVDVVVNARRQKTALLLKWSPILGPSA